MRLRAVRHPALLTLGRTRDVGQDRDRGHPADHIGGEPAGLTVQPVTVQIAQHPPEGPFAGHHVPAPPRVPPGPQPGQNLLRGAVRPLPDRRHRVVADHQRRARRQHQDHDQLMTKPAPPAPIHHPRQARDQRRRRWTPHTRRTRLDPGILPSQISQLAKNSTKRR